MDRSGKHGFEKAWAAVAAPRDGEDVSSDLRPLLQAAYEELIAEPVNFSRIKLALERLLVFLTEAGRTNANCWATDLLFAEAEGWERDWADRSFPDELRDILAYMGEALHDTVHDSHIAENFGCLPEQLLDRVRKLQTL